MIIEDILNEKFFWINLIQL